MLIPATSIDLTAILSRLIFFVILARVTVFTAFHFFIVTIAAAAIATPNITTTIAVTTFIIIAATFVIITTTTFIIITATTFIVITNTTFVIIAAITFIVITTITFIITTNTTFVDIAATTFDSHINFNMFATLNIFIT
jgi:hypothetical protein